jgi:hypothetical protein
MLVMLTARKITRRIPGALIAVIGAIIVSPRPISPGTV